MLLARHASSLPDRSPYRSGLVFFFFLQSWAFHRIVEIIPRGFSLFSFPGDFDSFLVESEKKKRKGGWLIRTVLYYLPNTPAACRLEKVVTNSQACSSQTQQKKGICYMLFIRCIYFMYIYIFYISNLYAIWRYKIHVYIKYVYFEKKYIYIYTSWIITLSLEISRLFLAILKNVLEKS